MDSGSEEPRDGFDVVSEKSSAVTSRKDDIETWSDTGNSNYTKGNKQEIIDIDGGEDSTVAVGNSDSVPVPQPPRLSLHQCEHRELEYEYIDVVWLKKDVRWTDHGPLSEVVGAGGGAAFLTPERQRRKFVVLYLYEPDQLREHSVHGSHLRFAHEGLVDMDGKLNEPTAGRAVAKATNISPCTTARSAERDDDDNNTKYPNTPSFQYLTVCHNTIISTLNAIHFRYPVSQAHSVSSSASVSAQVNGACASKKRCYKIARLLSHEETGHWQSYMRDRSVRKWCRTRSIPFLEFNQTGVTRRLKLRDDYLKLWKAFMAKPLYPKIDLKTVEGRAAVKDRLIQLDRLPGFLVSPRGIDKLFEIDGNHDDDEFQTDSGKSILEELPTAHRSDRSGRQQFGGETRAINTLDSFLSDRGARYSQHISSPNTSWNSCSRLSVYLTWGHISLRCVLKALEDRRDALRRLKAKGSPWLKSLQAFGSRAHWRSHFVQKLESEPTLEKRDLCPAYQHLRRQDGDWDPAKYTAWETGTTGYPFVDACMRCLIEHGWINFRMRAMLVSFATYNLWLDWKRIAPHLARVFLDYEPGIHYPQLQMQAGTTGINAMRVYNVTKQGKDQDPKGVFIRKYVPELRKVPDQYIHEPWKMSEALKDKYYKNRTSLFASTKASVDVDVDVDDEDCRPYPEPIVDEKESARIAKAKLNDVKKAVATRIQANQVYIKHGSRSRMSNESNHRVTGGGALPAAVAVEAGTLARGHRKDSAGRQRNIKDAFFTAVATASHKKNPSGVVDLTTVPEKNSTKKRPRNISTSQIDLTTADAVSTSSSTAPRKRSRATQATASETKNIGKSATIINFLQNSSTSSKGSWACSACTFLNDKPHAVVCSVCGTAR